MSEKPTYEELEKIIQELKETLHERNMFLDNIPDHMIIQDLEQRVIWANNGAVDSVGKKLEDIVGLHCYEIWQQSNESCEGCPILETMKTGKVKERETMTPNGHAYHIYGRPMYDRKGRIVGAFEYSRDISELKRAEQTLKESHDRFALLLDSLNAAIYVTDIDTYEILFMNKYIKNLFGDRVGEICWKAFHHGQSGPCEFCTNDKIVDESGEPTGPVVWDHYNPKVAAWWEIRDQAIQWTDGRIVRFEIALDISARKQAEEVLRESEKKYRELVENANSIILKYDLNGKIIFFNEYAQRLFGYRQDEIFGKNVMIIIPKAEITGRSLETLVQDILERPQEFVENINQNICKNGDLVWISWRNKGITDSEGKIIGNLAIGQDITERRQAEDALQQAHDKLEQRVMERTKELERKSRSIEDVNTALNVMLKKRDEDKLIIEERVLFNVKELIEPLIENLKKNGLNENQTGYVNTLETFLAEIVSPFSQTLHTKFLNLTLSEIRVANLIKEGKTTKEIASLLNSTPRAIEFHRQNLRKKLGLSSRKANLGSHLLSLID